jgi:hypothetical protein
MKMKYQHIFPVLIIFYCFTFIITEAPFTFDYPGVFAQGGKLLIFKQNYLYLMGDKISKLNYINGKTNHEGPTVEVIEFKKHKTKENVFCLSLYFKVEEQKSPIKKSKQTAEKI